jgi:hypothetical protein
LATAGDKASEPNWDERLSVTVGQKSGEMVGSTDKVLQAAVDYVGRYGGGTVRVLPGTYTLRSSVHLRSNVRLLGTGDEMILTKPASTTTKLADSVAIDVQGSTEQGTLRQNGIKETRGPAQRIGIRLGKETKEIKLVENKFAGLMADIVQA